MKVLVTGGLGYIGSHVVASLLRDGHQVITLDNQVPGVRRPLFRGESFVLADITQANQLLGMIGTMEGVEAIVHLAALIDAPQSVRMPELYYSVNFMGTNNVLALARALGVKNIVFASSAAVYGSESTVPLNEVEAILVPENPYGGSKLFSERLLEDACFAHGMNSVMLRFFNVVGCDAERVGVIPTNGGMFSAVVNARLTKRPIKLYGGHHPTEDGFAVRDYVHVVDVAESVKKSVNHLISGGSTIRCNIGSGIGTSTLQVVKLAAEHFAIDYEVAHPRPGDVPASIACVNLAEDILGWKAKKLNLADALLEEHDVRRKATLYMA